MVLCRLTSSVELFLEGRLSATLCKWENAGGLITIGFSLGRVRGLHTGWLGNLMIAEERKTLFYMWSTLIYFTPEQDCLIIFSSFSPTCSHYSCFSGLNTCIVILPVSGISCHVTKHSRTQCLTMTFYFSWFCGFLGLILLFHMALARPILVAAFVGSEASRSFTFMSGALTLAGCWSR